MVKVYVRAQGVSTPAVVARINVRPERPRITVSKEQRLCLNDTPQAVTLTVFQVQSEERGESEDK